MTRVRWTPKAADDFAAIVERIRQDNSAAAQRVARTIYTAIADFDNSRTAAARVLRPTLAN